MTTEALTVREEAAIAEVVPETPAPIPHSIIADPYTGVAAMPFNERAQQVLTAYQQVPDEWIDIRPEGLIYLSHMKARRILNEAFGFGGWAIVPIGEFRTEEKGNHILLYRTYRLYVDGRYAGEVESSGDYWTNNSAQNYADAAEACQSYALNRLAKNFGIASQCWDKAYGEEWKRRFAEQKDGKWRKRDANNIATTKREATPPAERSTPVPEGPSGAVIRVASIGSRFKAPGNIPGASVKDMEGKTWAFQGPLVIALAEAALESGEALSIQYERNGNFLNVKSAAWATE